ncbi:MAG: hypothetical protein JST79_06510 [Acidobacteria bacterium]|nr:hypothetical protein [Acidobacteriota bacterium]
MTKWNRWTSVSSSAITLAFFLGLILLQSGLLVYASDKTDVSCQVWPSQPSADNPFPASSELTGICFTGRTNQLDAGDTWYPSWASDGNLYSPWTDGRTGGVLSLSFSEAGLHLTRSKLPPGIKATTGHATLIGDDAMHLKIVDPGVHSDDPAPYQGRYPSGSLVYNGVWYYGTYTLLDTDGDPATELNWDVLGPFVGFRYSLDYGKTWQESPHTPLHPLFESPVKRGDPVKMGAPHFVDFGKNMEHSPDGKAYLVGHGAVSDDPKPRPANLSWITADQVYLARVKPSIKNMNDKSKYEFFGGNDASGRPIWTKDFSRIRPLVEWNNNMGVVTVTYDAPLKKYLMCITDGVDTISRFNTYILESSKITGPWKMVTYMHHFGEQAYFVNIPSKFISEDGKTMWLAYSANFIGGYQSNPPESGYGLSLHEIKLLP